MIDYTISIGNILTVISVMLSAVAFVYTLRGDLRVMKNDIEYLQESQRNLNEAFTQLGAILTSVAVQDQRLNMLEKRIQEIRENR